MSLNVLSTFNGMGCIWLALDKISIEVGKRYSSEIDKYANIVNDANYPDTIQLGDVTKIRAQDLDKIDLLVGGSPCQGFSFAGKQLNFDDPRSALFFEFVRLLKEVREINPEVNFLLENVKMKKEYQAVISEHLGVEPIEINSALVSAQNRRRLYWTNIPCVRQPEDRGIILKDVLQPENEIEEKFILSDKMHKGFLNKTGDFGKKFKPQIDKINPKAACLTGNMHKIQVTGDYICVSMCGRNIVDGKRKDYKGAPTEQRLEINREGKTNCLTPVGKDDLILLVPEATKKGFAEIEPGQVFDAENPNSKTRRGRKMDTKSNCLVAKTTDFIKYTEDYNLRRLTPIECERLQTVPDNYTDHVSNTQRYKMLGNGWTVDTIAHILNNFDLL